jgi:4-hydroxy-4-methyl-2-oxoglutarate aldolase
MPPSTAHDPPHGVTSASLCDAMALRHAHRCHAMGLMPARPGAVTAGPAATIRFGPRRDDLPAHDLAAAAEHALADVPPGGIVVIAAPDAPAEAVAGGKKLAALEELGAAGVVAWGAIRDRHEASGYGMGVWALGETPRASGDLLQVIDVGVPVAFGGITVVPGDWVYVDEAGLVSVPWDEQHDVVEEARRIERDDADAVRRIRGG